MCHAGRVTERKPSVSAMRAFCPMLVPLFGGSRSLSCTSEPTADITVPVPVASLSVEPTRWRWFRRPFHRALHDRSHSLLQKKTCKSSVSAGTPAGYASDSFVVRRCVKRIQAQRIGGGCGSRAHPLLGREAYCECP